MFLHVGPHENPFGVSGLFDKNDAFATDSCFWEIFEHSRRLLNAIHSLADSCQLEILPENKPARLKHLGDAWERTQEMQQIWSQMTGITKETNEDIEDQN